MKAAIRERALELGFDDCRFTNADAPVSSGHFEKWIASGQHGEMGYLSRNAHRRVDPQEVLPGAKSLVCLALNYGDTSCGDSETGFQKYAAPSTSAINTGVPSYSYNSRSPALRGIVARYAAYRDYHDVMGDRLRLLAEFIGRAGGNKSRALWYVDTGPILEREFAQRAGLGFVGKHTNVISRRFGNWILLGEILTTLELDPDPPATNRCGTCTRCITACPTNAITGPFQLDARLCISYLTIELKDSIPLNMRPAIGNRIFGCDDCLAVCPWNRFASESRVMKRFQREDLREPDLLDLLSLNNATFKQRFRGTPIERSKRRGLLRNVCVALGNTADRRALPVLEKAAHDVEPLIAEHAQWAIGRIERGEQSASSSG